LLRHYCEPHRLYHNIGHIGACLGQLDLALDHVADPMAVELALWFHDVIYDPHAPDNERQSAEYWRIHANGFVAPELVDKVHELILLTIHDEEPAEPSGQYLVDIDLSGFGQDRSLFERDGDSIRREYPHLSDRRYYANLFRFLKPMLERPNVYRTAFFRERYEARARMNIQRELARIAACAAFR
jgi:predicted metal-dependent HD superfamily phosphohydrolase